MIHSFVKSLGPSEDGCDFGCPRSRCHCCLRPYTSSSSTYILLNSATNVLLVCVCACVRLHSRAPCQRIKYILETTTTTAGQQPVAITIHPNRPYMSFDRLRPCCHCCYCCRRCVLSCLHNLHENSTQTCIFSKAAALREYIHDFHHPFEYATKDTHSPTSCRRCAPYTRISNVWYGVCAEYGMEWVRVCAARNLYEKRMRAWR